MPPGRPVTQSPGCPALRSSGHPVIRSSGCPVVRSSGYPVTWSHGHGAFIHFKGGCMFLSHWTDRRFSWLLRSAWHPGTTVFCVILVEVDTLVLKILSLSRRPWRRGPAKKLWPKKVSSQAGRYAYTYDICMCAAFLNRMKPFRANVAFSSLIVKFEIWKAVVCATEWSPSR